MTGDAYDKFFERADRGRFGDNEAAPTPRSNAPRVTGASDLKDVELALHHETSGALLLSTGKSGTKPVWIPKSQCEVTPTGRYVNVWNDDRRRHAAEVIATMPEWLARDKGLV